MSSPSATILAESYRITQTQLNGWTLQGPEDYIEALKAPRLTKSFTEFMTLAAHFNVNFRREVELEGFAILASVFPEQKLILISSRRLSRELCLLDALEQEKLENPKLNAHASAISTLDPTKFPSEWEWVTAREKLSDWREKQKFEEVEELTREKLRTLVKHVQSYHPTVFERLSDWGLGLTAQFALIRIHLLKYLALLPSLDHDKVGHEVKKNLVESLRRLSADNDVLRKKGPRTQKDRPLPRGYAMAVSVGLAIARFLPAKFLAIIVRFLVKKMARRFIAGESINSAHKVLQSIHESRREATLDQLGELVVFEGEAEEYLARVITIINGLKVHVSTGERNDAGINKAHVSIKVSALAHDFKPHAFESSYSQVAPRLKKILLEAKKEVVFINVDAEHYHYRDVVFQIYRKVLLETPELHGWGDTGIVLQAYLRDGAKHLRDIVALAAERQVRMPIRLVKGAYWDAETIEAQVHAHAAPQFLNKEESDLHFRQLAHLALENGKWIQLAVGSHNLQDHCFVESLRMLHFPEAPTIEHQCLHMTYEALSEGMVKMGWPVRNYMPIGNLLIGMAYLVRRIMENSSQVGILTIMRSHNQREAFSTPLDTHEQKIKLGLLEREPNEARLGAAFVNVTPLRLYHHDEYASFVGELKSLEEHLLKNQAKFKAQEGEKIFSNSRPELVVGVSRVSDAHEVLEETQKMNQDFAQSAGWCALARSARIAVMLKAADLMWMERQRLAALIVFEAGKTWGEALADVDEAIDFINFYLRQGLNLKTEARGPTLVIAPWNFPLAIPCGMAVAPLIAGNPVILKPAEQTPLIGEELVHLLHRAGVPKEALKLVNGPGEIVAAPLVKSPLIAAIVFTGSKAVGQWIYQTAGTQEYFHPRLKRMISKRVITEMGGKNAIIVTNNCEQDETVSGILYSAFAHAGQKCSAASRILVDEEIKDVFLKRLVKAVADLPVGSALDPKVVVNPLVTQGDQERVRSAVASATKEAEEHNGKVWIDRSQEAHLGFNVGPAIIELPAERAMTKDSWALREVFGPLIHVIGYRGMDQAIKIFNSTEYGLTGGVYGQSQDDIDYLTSKMKCGNIYVNRPNTGARVAIEPFGGFKLSGTGPKAGGTHYLESFTLQEMAVDENISVAESKGGGYQFVVPSESRLSLSGREARLSKFTDSVVARFEIILGKLSEGDKRQFKSFCQWLRENFPAHLEGAHPNRRIPGQMSFDRLDVCRESLVMVVGHPYPQTADLLHLMSAIAAGTGVAILCSTDDSYNHWKGVCDLAHHAGLSHVNLECYLYSRSEIREALKRPEISAVYLSGPESWRKDLLQDACPQESLAQHMRTIYTHIEHPAFGDWGSWVDQYLYVRSFAINTMRHGAPLEIEG